MGPARTTSPGPHHRQPVRDGERLLVVVGDHQRGGAGGQQDLAQVDGEPLAQRRVQRGQRLVEQQQPGLHRQRTGQGDPLPLAAGQGAREAVVVPLEADERQQLARPGPPTGGGAAAAGRPRCRRRVRWVKSCPSWNISAKPRLWVAGGRPARRRGDATPRQRLEPGDRAQQGGLAAAGRAQHREHRPVGHVEADVADGGDVVVRDADVGEAQHHRAPRLGTRRRSTTSITPAVAPARTTEAASAMP